MTDQPTDPQNPPTGDLPAPLQPPGPYAAQPPAPGQPAATPQPPYAEQPPYAAQPPAPGQPPAPPAGPQPTYAPQPYPPAQPAPQQPYGGYPPAQQANPYGGYTMAPQQAAGAAYPGTLGYVQAHFGPVASFGQRVLASLLDGLLVLIGLVPIIIGSIIMIANAPDQTYDEYGMSVSQGGSSSGVALGGFLLFLGFLLMLAIGIWNRVFRMGRTGQSWGKKIIGLKLINDQTGQPIGAGSAFLRELLHWLINQIFYLSYLWMLWDDNKQTLADKVIHSTVVQVPKG